MDMGYIRSIYVVEWGAGWSILKLFPCIDIWWNAKKCQANMMPTASDDGILLKDSPENESATYTNIWCSTVDGTALLETPGVATNNRKTVKSPRSEPSIIVIEEED